MRIKRYILARKEKHENAAWSVGTWIGPRVRERIRHLGRRKRLERSQTTWQWEGRKSGKGGEVPGTMPALWRGRVNGTEAMNRVHASMADSSAPSKPRESTLKDQKRPPQKIGME